MKEELEIQKFYTQMKLNAFVKRDLKKEEQLKTKKAQLKRNQGAEESCNDIEILQLQ